VQLAPSATAASSSQEVATPTATAVATGVILDLSLPRSSSSSFVPIFSGTLSMRAGDSVTKTLQVQNNGTVAFEYRLATSGGTGALWTDATNGLQIVVTRNGTEVYRGSLQMAQQVIGQVARGGQDELSIQVSLPSTAGNSFQRLSTTVSFDFTSVGLP
jgi:hypothetical protein